MNTPRYPRRPNVDALIAACMYMTRECLRINITGKSFEAVEDETRRKLYEALDKNLGGPPPSTAPKQPDYETEYFTLYNNVVMLQQLLAIPHTPGSVNMNTILDRVEGLRWRIRELQRMTVDSSTDMNRLIHAINNLWPVKL